MMDPATIIYSTTSKELTLPNNIKVNLSPEFNRQKLPESDEEAILTNWKKRCTELPSLFNGTKFRLDSVVENGGNLLLNLGITCYRDFQGTNVSENMTQLQCQGLCDHANSQAYMSDALGVGALVITRDEHVVLMFRSKNCGEDINLWDRPGGHPEPKAVVGNKTMEGIDVCSLDPGRVVAELFQSITGEVVSEVNIPEQHLQPPAILGLHRSNRNGGKPNIEFLVRCDLNAAEVESRYREGNQEEAYESERILLLPLETALNLEMTRPDVYSKLAAGAYAVLTLYNMYKHRFL